MIFPLAFALVAYLDLNVSFFYPKQEENWTFVTPLDKLWSPCFVTVCWLADITCCLFYFVQVAPTSSKQHGVNVGVNASATPFQQASGYGSHGYSTGEALNDIEAACLEGSCRSCSIYLHTNNSVLCLTTSPLISHRCGVHISFELCSICKHKHDACVQGSC